MDEAASLQGLESNRASPNDLTEGSKTPTPENQKLSRLGGNEKMTLPKKNKKTSIPEENETTSKTEENQKPKRGFVTLNVSGKVYKTTMATLAKLPQTKLYKVCSNPELYPEFYRKERNEFYFDRNPHVIVCVLGLYRTGKLHLPIDLCSQVIQHELNFWEIPESMIAYCCWVHYSQNLDGVRLASIYLETLKEMMVMDRYWPETTREKIWMALEYPFHSRYTKIWNIFSLLIVLLAVIVVILSYSPEYRVPLKEDSSINLTDLFLNDPFNYYGKTKAQTPLFILDCFCLIFFVMELILRFATSPDRLLLLKQFTVQLDTVVVLLYVIILIRRFLAVLEVPLTKPVQNFVNVINMLIPLRALRIINFMQKMAVSKMFYRSLHRNFLELVIVMVICFTSVIVFGAIVFSLERISKSMGVRTLPDALWWSLATVTTVGYGDEYPQSGLGRLAAGVAIIFSIIFISMPTAVILSSFSRAHTIINSMIGRTTLNSSSTRETKRER